MAKIFRALLIAAVNTIKEFFAFATEDCFHTGLINCEEVGTLTENDGVYSGFSSSNYINATPYKQYHNNFIFTTRVKLTSSGSNCIIGNGDDNYTGGGFVLRTSSGIRLYFWGIYNNSWAIGQFDTFIDLTLNEFITIKMEWDGSTYKFYSKTDSDEDFTLRNTLSDPNPCSVPYVLKFGESGSTDYYFRGEIDMKATSITTDDTTTNYYSTQLEVGDTAKLNDGMATSNYDWSAYSSVQGQFTKTGVIEQIKQVGSDTLFATQEPEQDNKDITINTGKVYYAYTNENDEGVYTKQPLKFNLQNASVIGNLINDNSIYLGFTNSNYIKLSDAFMPGDNNWSVTLRVKTPTTLDRRNLLFGTISGFFYGFAIELMSNGCFGAGFSTNGSEWNIGWLSGSTVVDLNTWYLVRVSFNGSEYKLETKKDGGSWTTEGTPISNSSSIYQNAANSIYEIGSTSTNSDSYTGYVDLAGCFIKIDNTTTTFVPYYTLYNSSFQELNPQPNYVISYPQIKDCASIGCTNIEEGKYTASSGHYIQTNNSFDLSSADSWELETVYQYNGGGYEPVIWASGPSDFCGAILLTSTSTNKVRFYASSTGPYSWNLFSDAYLNVTMQLGGIYHFKLGFNTTDGYYFYAYKEGEANDYPSSPNWSDSTTTKIKSNSPMQFLNWGLNYNQYFSNGYINFNNTKMIVDGITTNFSYINTHITIDNTNYYETFDNNLLQPITATIETTDNTIINSVSITSDQTATIETSANITTSNNDTVITDGSYHLFNLTIPTGMTPIIESSGISYQTNEMPLLLKSNTGVGLLIKDGNNAYYRNSWIITKDYDLHYQQINFSYPSGATVTCKVNNVSQSNLTPYTYTGDVVSWTCNNAGAITTGTYIVKYSNLDGNIQTITIS